MTKINNVHTYSIAYFLSNSKYAIHSSNIFSCLVKIIIENEILILFYLTGEYTYAA